jgi:UDP-N-acetylmuramoyl-tripeptide--D-alanyl-D-alanine ligase
MNSEALYDLFLNSKGICTDTRNIVPNTLFFALKGANFNANEFAHQALEDGCTYAIVDEMEFADREGCILVEDVQQTLQNLARHHRRQFNIPIIGITGSNGKTTSKELIGAVLLSEKKVLITEGNLNNQLGVPFTILKLTSEHEIAIIEMGASKVGDIRELVEIAEPTVGIITNIGAAHIEGFGSLEAVVQTKTEIYQFIEERAGLTIYNSDDEILREYLPRTGEKYAYGSSGNVRGTVVNLDPYVTFNWATDDYQSEDLETKLIGEYNFTNFLLAVAVGNYFGISNENINSALKSYEPSNRRSQLMETDRNTLIVDCYNANPTSMTAAIKSFSKVNSTPRMMILGDMLELGDISGEEHQKIADLAATLNIETLLVGAEFAGVQTEFNQYSDWQELEEDYDLDELEHQLILLKGSRGIRLEELIPFL